VRIDRTISPDWPSELNKDFRAKESARVRQRTDQPRAETDQPLAEPSAQRIINRRFSQTGEQQSAKRMAQSVKSIVLRAINRRWRQINTDEEN